MIFDASPFFTATFFLISKTFFKTENHKIFSEKKENISIERNLQKNFHATFTGKLPELRPESEVVKGIVVERS